MKSFEELLQEFKKKAKYYDNKRFFSRPYIQWFAETLSTPNFVESELLMYYQKEFIAWLKIQQ